MNGNNIEKKVVNMKDYHSFTTTFWF